MKYATILSPLVLFLLFCSCMTWYTVLRDIVMVYYHEGGLEIERTDLALHDTNYCSKEFLVYFFISLVLTLIFPPFFVNSLHLFISSPLFPRSPIISPFSQTWLDPKLHVYRVLSTVCYYHPLENRSKALWSNQFQPQFLCSVCTCVSTHCFQGLY